MQPNESTNHVARAIVHVLLGARRVLPTLAITTVCVAPAWAQSHAGVRAGVSAAPESCALLERREFGRLPQQSQTFLSISTGRAHGHLSNPGPRRRVHHAE